MNPEQTQAERRRARARKTGNAGDPICPSASGARCARITPPTATCWDYFPHDHARSRAYRWGEDGLLGICDREGRLCFALALWNGHDPILKERLFGLTGHEGNHGEDVKECYFYLDSTPDAFVHEGALQVSAGGVSLRRAASKRTAGARAAIREFELIDTGIFDENRYFDVIVEYAKASPERHSDPHHASTNRGPEACAAAPPADALVSQHLVVGPHRRRLLAEAVDRSRTRRRRRRASTRRWASIALRGDRRRRDELLFTENETNFERLFGIANATRRT